VVKNTILRDQLAKEYGLLYFKIEAAGALANFPYIIICGILNYYNLHKNNQWHRYTAAAAAVYTRQLFFHILINKIKRCILASNS